MGGTIVLTFWLLLAAVFGIFWLGFLAVFLIGRKRQSQLLKFLGGVPLFCSSVFALWFAGNLIVGFVRTQSPANVYRIAFGFPPSTDVTNMNSSYYYFADTGQIYLRFNASPQTIDKIAGLGLRPYSPDELAQVDFSDLGGHDTPAWWKPVKTQRTRCYEAQKRVGDFSTMEDEFLCYDESTKVAFYYYIGID